MIIAAVVQVGTGDGKGYCAVGSDGHIALGIKHTVHGDGNACDLHGSDVTNIATFVAFRILGTVINMVANLTDFRTHIALVIAGVIVGVAGGSPQRRQLPSA